MSADSKSCLEAWQAIDLVNVQLALDEQACSVADYCAASSGTRKELAAKTKEFRKRDDVKNASDDSVMKTQVLKLLRSYQQEIDSLTQRAKFAENCFLSMYRLIREAPDPSEALLEFSKESLNAQTELALQKEKLFEKEREVAKLKAKLDASSGALVKNQNSIAEQENELEEKIKSMESELRENLELEIDQKYQDKFEELRSKHEEELANLQMQLELQLAEVDRSSEQILALEAKLEHQQTTSPKDSVNQIENQEKQRLEEENTTLLKDLDVARESEIGLKNRIKKLQLDIEDLEKQHEDEKNDFKKLLDDKSKQLDQSRQRLSECASKEEYDKLKNQLLVIQRELYNVQDVNNNNNSETTAASTNEEEDKLDGLETWFLTSTRQLKKDLMIAKRTIDEQKQEIVELKQTEQRLGEALRDQSELAAKLEMDLALGTAKIGKTAVNNNTSGGGGGIAVQQLLQSSSNNQVDVVQSSGEYQQQQMADEPQQQKQNQAMNSMLQAVCSQRDRLRAQLQSKEETFDEQRRKLVDLEQSLRKLKEDNVQLYQRIRFLQNYKASERSTLITDGMPTETGGGDLEKGSAVVLSSQGNAKVGGLGRGVEHKYKSLYESDMNPLETFKKQEQKRLYQDIPHIERLALQTCNAFLTRSRGRIFIVVYSVLVHLLILRCLMF